MQDSSASSTTRWILILIAGSICISFAPIFVKMLGQDKMGLTAIGFWRTFLGGIILLLIGFVKDKNLTIPKPLIGWSVLAGFLFFLDLFIWHRSIAYAGAGMATILANTQVFGTAVLSYFIFREKLTVKFFIAAISALVGVVLLVGVISDIAFTPQYLKGILFGLATGIVYANYLVTLKMCSGHDRKFNFITFIAWTSLITSLFLVVASPFEHGAFWPPDLHSFVVLFLLALVAQSLGWWAIFSSLSKIPASRAGLILLLQPTLATVWGFLFFREELALSQLTGAVITLWAIYYGTVTRSKKSG